MKEVATFHMPMHYSFNHFKDFAQYLLNNHEEALAITYFQLLVDANAPLLQQLMHLTHEQKIEISRASVSDFLKQVLNDTALAAALEKLEQWHADQLELFKRESIRASDIIISFSVRRTLYRKFLPLYTREMEKGILIMDELEGFLNLLTQRSFSLYEEIQQEALRKERSLFKSVISNSIDGIIAFDKELRIVALNKVLEEHFSVAEEKVLGKKIFEAFPDYENTEEGKAFLQVLRGQSVSLKERQYLKKPGFYNLLTVPLLNKQGTMIGGVSVVHDISERKAHDEALHQKQIVLQEQADALMTSVEELRASNEELEKTRAQLQQLNTELEERVHQRTEQLEYQRQWLYTLFMQVPGLIGIVSGKEGTVVLCNHAFSSMWGGRQVLGLPMREAWPELEGQGYFEILEDVLNTGKAVSRLEFPSLIDRHNDGQLHQGYFNFTFSPFLNPSGEIEGVILYGVDVTDQVEARLRIEQSEEKLSMALEAGQMGIWDYDPTTDTSSNSLYFHQLYGYTEASLAWSFGDYLSHIAEDYRDKVVQTFQKAMEQGSLNFETEILKADGATGWASVKGKVYYDAQGAPLRVVGVMADISERKRAEAALQQSHQELKRTNTDLDNFIYTASHDLRSPIVNLEGLIMMLQRNLTRALEPQSQQLLDMMATSIGRLKRTIDGLTDITRIQKEDEQRETILVHDLLQEVKQDIHSMLVESGAQLTLDLQVSSLEFARHNLRSILYNLLSNAVKYRKADEALQITVSTYLQGDYTVLRVEDNGLGINEANQKKLFSMFKRFHSHVRGSGIGLYLVKRIIDNAGGKIDAHSREGVGSRFCVYFPLQH